MKKKIYCFNNGGSPEWLHAVAICEDGTCLAQHICSNESFMRYDLGLTSTRKHENYNKHCGEGNWELVWVDDPKKNTDLAVALALNQKQPTEGSGESVEREEARR